MMVLHHEFIRVAKQRGGETAIIDRNTNRTISYSKALIASLILADKFSRYDKGFIGLMIPTSAGCSLSMLGALMSGRVPVMINYSTGAAANIEYAQKKCAFKTVITSRALVEKINCPTTPSMVFIEDIMASITLPDKLSAGIKSKLPYSLLLRTVHGGDASDTSVILFTSGSEKEPRAVELSHRNIASNIEGVQKMFRFTIDEVMLANLPYFHVFGLTVNHWLPLLMGMKVVPYANPLDFRKICDIIREEKVTFVVGTPSFLWGYLKKSEPGDFASVRVTLSGADKCPDALRKGFKEKHNVVLLEGYGATETSPVITANTHERNRPGSVGWVVPGVKVRIERYDTGDECRPDEVGKILVKGDNVMKGYFDDFEETSYHIRHGWYDTGDMGTMDADGFLWHVGRLKRFMKVGGEMISLVRVEEVLEKNLPDDVACCVVEIPDALKGGRIAAAVTKKIDEKSVLKKMSEELPNISLPKLFVVIDEFPKMGSGKIDFRSVTTIVREMVQKAAV
jgi:acyl-[acyl-carrier-protein]-phospholipid O-acyltransferase / long-chain-fatty-acid--[acyl-carrier-protein] ligase